MASRKPPRLKRYQGWAENELAMWWPRWSVAVAVCGGRWSMTLCRDDGKQFSRDLEPVSPEEDIREGVRGCIEALRDAQ